MTVVEIRSQARAFLSRPLALAPQVMEQVASIASAEQPVTVSAEDATPGRVAARRPMTERASGGNALAVVPLKGVITPTPSLFAMLFGGGSGALNVFREQLAAALADPDVASIVLDVDSPGGLVDQVPETAAAIRAGRDIKPIAAVANTTAASAAYWLASQANELFVTPSGQVGSIGVYRAHVDRSGFEEQRGVRTTLISAGKFKTDGNPYEPLSDSAREHAQASVDYTYGQFLDDVAAGRDDTLAAVAAGYGEGRMLDPEPAVAAGLADGIQTLSATIAGLLHPAPSASTAHSAQTPDVGPKAAEHDNRERLLEQFAGFLPPI